MLLIYRKHQNEYNLFYTHAYESNHFQHDLRDLPIYQVSQVKLCKFDIMYKI